ncbi:hypothetical protein CBOM_02340 [Ceraceosorus bombacis]|uniref:Uncharacterized protein n=1 Tax=Ceraceosorus bombacis TaxID=401625 RepID=A0A0P1BF29_9BASI|nr:hypothetical protein CBOM_02340 [Ceraceosorus bombacis]
MFAVKSLCAVAVLASSVAAQAKFQYGTPNPNMSGVVGRNSNGPTNPKTPQENTPVNQTSMARLVSVNSVDDWCIYGPPENGQTIANVEGEVVAYCTKPRNNARVIPDGTVTAAHFVKTPLYVQLMALGDFTKIGFAPGDQGGELDPHGATNMGNPVGGNVTSNVSGKDVFYEEWMNFVSADQACIRICIAGTDVAPTPLECQHTLDEMGCNWVMPGNYADNSFDTCDGDAAYPPGLFPQPDGSTSTFQQYFSSVYTAPGGDVQTFINASPDQQTPSAAYSLPSTSQCTTTSSIANGIKSLVSGSSSSGISTTRTGANGASNTGTNGSGSGNSSGSSSSGGNSGAASLVPGAGVAGILTLSAALVAGAMML